MNKDTVYSNPDPTFSLTLLRVTILILTGNVKTLVVSFD
jgi:hypothetical protein